MDKVEVNGPAADVEKAYPVSGPTEIEVLFSPTPEMLKEFGPAVIPEHTLPKAVSDVTVSCGATELTVHVMVTSSNAKP